MAGFLKSLFGKEKEPTPQTSLKPIQEIGPKERLDDLWVELKRTLECGPGQNFWVFVTENEIQILVDWFRPETECALANAFIKLAVALTRSGRKLWEIPGITMMYKGNWTACGGKPPQLSQDAVSVLAQIFKITIKVLYTESEDATDYLCMDFLP